MLTRPTSAAAWIILATLPLLAPAAGAPAPEAQVIEGSVRMPDPGGLTMGRVRIVRALAPGELSASMAFSVSLKMRDLAGLQARVAAGEQVPQQEMEASYLPFRADYDRLAGWLAAQGFTQTLPDRLHTTVFVRGSVSGISRALGVGFARVAAADGEYTSAISEPALPPDLATLVLSVNGLQPQFRLRRVGPAPAPQPDDLVDHFIYVTPDNVVSAYNIPASATGAGQVIAIVGEAPLPAGDLTAFWGATGVPQSLGNITTINIDGGPPADTDGGVTFETDLDVEWASALATGVQIRLYLASDALQAFNQVSNDLPAFPTMRVLSSSYGNTEGGDGSFQLREYSQLDASLAAAGVSILCASGDAGSNPNGSTSSGAYLASAPLDVSFPASDPSVTGVGGTTVGYTGNWDYTGEAAWNEIAASMSASGGGVSSFFAKPSWQVGGPVLAGQTMRCVPDVSAISDSVLTNVNLGSQFEPFSGSAGVFLYDSFMAPSGGPEQAASGTSLSAPVWAAVAAMINQGRAANGLGPIGLLNPHLYPLAGSGVFNDVTSGNNGAYSAGPGYDLCSGLGTPNVANLIAALGGQTTAQRLANISSRAEVETGANILIAGFAIQGPPGTTKEVLVRGIGPALTTFNVAGALPTPVVSVYDSMASPALIASDTGWGNAPVMGASTVAATFRRATAADMGAVGAFALTAGSADSAMVLTLPIGNYTVQVAGQGSATGVALAEVYDLETSSPAVLGNISSRNFVGTGSQVAIPGFVVKGNQSAQLLIRGVGPALDAFGLTGTLAQPSIGVFDSGSVLVASDTGWGNPPVAGTSTVAASFRQATAADMSAAGAFALPAGSADSAIVVTLPPGNYTAVVSGIGNTTGTALAEVYELTGN